MPIQLPNLDNRTYDDLVQEALSLIPTYAPEWTNHNPSDPGITLIELFAYLTEMLNYRLNRVTNANKQTFLNLITENKYPLFNEKGEPKLLDEKTLNEEIRKTVVNLRKANRAVTCKDFEELALAFNQTTDKKSPQNVARARCLPHRNLESPNSSTVVIDSERPGHVSVVIVPDKPQPNSQLQPTDELLQEVWAYLEPKRLLTTRLHLVGPRYLTIRVQITLVLKPGAKEIKLEDLDDNLEAKEPSKKDSVLPQVIKALRKFFSPLKGGQEGKGWEFGRNVYLSEIYELLDKQPGIDYVEKVERTGNSTTKVPEDEIVVEDKQRELRVNGQLSAVELKANELVNFQIQKRDIQIPKDGGRITISPADTSVTVTGG
ncbi:baseplate J/gp47 family protein [Floridanema aerugineum]|uniref:Baseplate J/gp47 family protein n=1 Tax=Floridaenema aerugineum BLCC-F46 TaxID=3153654 RepID=A0ABV4WXY8_9CYAN